MKKVTIHKAGQKPISFIPGGLHKSTHTKQGEKIPAAKMQKALSGGYGKLARHQAEFARNVLTGRKKH